MHKYIFITFFLTSTTFLYSQTILFKNGLWFNGKEFVSGSFYSVNGIFKSKTTNRVDTVYNLSNKFILPPFADAHTHNLDGSFELQKQIQQYVKEGTQYVMVLTNYSSGAAANRPLFNKPGSLDVWYANGGITCTLGHPFMAYEPRAIGIYQWWDPNKFDTIIHSRTGEGKVYWFFDTKEDVDKKWNEYLSSKPDIVKIYLLDTKHHEILMHNGKAGDKGLSEEVAAYVVKKAHDAGLRVAAHIETMDDFTIGLQIGVDIFAHMPFYGYNGKDSITYPTFSGDEIKIIKKKKVIVIPTASLNEVYSVVYDVSNNYKGKFDSARFISVISFQKKMLSILKNAGFTIAIGSDRYGSSITQEYSYWFAQKLFDPLFIINTLCTTTPRVIFPKRKIGFLNKGYEASFIVLDKNPLEDWNNLKTVSMVIKQGIQLTIQ